jgi:hypothetical protein
LIFVGVEDNYDFFCLFFIYLLLSLLLTIHLSSSLFYLHSFVRPSSFIFYLHSMFQLFFITLFFPCHFIYIHYFTFFLGILPLFISLPYSLLFFFHFSFHLHHITLPTLCFFHHIIQIPCPITFFSLLSFTFASTTLNSQL